MKYYTKLVHILLFCMLYVRVFCDNSYLRGNTSQNNINNTNNTNNTNLDDTTSLGTYSNDTMDESRRRLSLNNDLFTLENVKTKNGKVPQVTCPIGKYRPPGSTNVLLMSGPRSDGCLSCPKGRFGDVKGLTNSMCSGLW